MVCQICIKEEPSYGTPTLLQDKEKMCVTGSNKIYLTYLTMNTEIWPQPAENLLKLEIIIIYLLYVLQLQQVGP